MQSADSTGQEGRIADNILLFCRTLRSAGLPIGPGQVIEAGSAVLRTGIARRDEFYFALRSVLVNDPSQFRLFDQAFHIYFRNPRLLERLIDMLLPTISRDTDGGNRDQALRRLLETMTQSADVVDEETVIEIDRSASYSRREILRRKDFEEMSLREQSEAKQLLREDFTVIKDIPTRRFRPHPFGHRYDLRRTMQLMLRNNGQLIQLAKKKRRFRPPTLVLLCDISGSMSGYSRIFLHFAHAMSLHRRSVHSFVFGTRLTNISHRLIDRDVDRALSNVAGDVEDWDGGTRIADCLERFNVDWGRRVLAGRSVVILLSDGLERDSHANLEFQMQRLRNSCDQLIWLNPMLRYEFFEAKAMGIRTMLPHVDRFLPAHNLESLHELGQVLQGGGQVAELPA
ncbi:MAG: VWA domain-containing protein [Woeseiaceae bacterium]|nr:VWA domain-containing protein [Woeseiaceae bacterium]